MKNQTKQSLLLHLGILAVSGATLLLSTKTVFAEGQSLSIYPPVIEVQTTPPSSPLVPIVIQNNNSEDVTLQIELIPFKTNNISGQIILMPEEIHKGFYPYYKDKIQFLVDSKKTNSISLQALESKEVDLNINLAQGDPPGDYYFSIVFISSGNTTEGTNVSRIPTGIATNLLLSIGPKDEASGGISQFSTSSFKNAGPVNFVLKLHNASKHVINPTGSIEISNIFGKKVGSVKILPQFVLARSDRFLLDNDQGSPSSNLTTELNDKNLQVIWPEKFLLGFYKAKARIQLEENESILTSNTYFLAFPLYLFFPLVAAIFVALSIYLRVKNKI